MIERYHRHAIHERQLSELARSAPILTVEQETELAGAASHGDRQAFDILILAHLRLVLSIAHEFAKYGAAKEDVVDEGVLGLMEATRRFDPRRGIRLSTYAGYWIRGRMRRFTIDNRRLVRAPETRHARRLVSNLRQAQRYLTQTHGGPPDSQEVADALHVERREVEEVEGVLSGRDIPFDDEASPIEIPTDSPSPEEMLAEAEVDALARKSIGRALMELDGRERRVLEQRYLRGDRQSLARVGRDLGLSRERVRQIERSAQARLRDVVQHVAVVQ